jgi:hypothetical protein
MDSAFSVHPLWLFVQVTWFVRQHFGHKGWHVERGNVERSCCEICHEHLSVHVVILLLIKTRLLYKNKKLIKKRQNCITLTCESPEEYCRASSLCSSWLMWLNRFSENCKWLKKITTIINSILHTALQRKSHLLIPFLGIARHQSQFPHSCVCERFIYSQDRSKYFGCSKIDRLIVEIYKSLTDIWAQELGDRTLWFCFGNKEAARFPFWEYINGN